MAKSGLGKDEQILVAAQSLFLRLGLRGTSMEAVARQAGVAKPTLYKYFADKQAIYDALLTRLLEELRRIAEAAFAGPGSATERVAAALAGKHKFLFQFLEGSPHAEELYMAPKRESLQSLEAFDRWLKAEIVSAFAREGQSDGVSLAPLLMATADGIARHATRAGEIGPAIRFTVARLSARG